MLRSFVDNITTDYEQSKITNTEEEEHQPNSRKDCKRRSLDIPVSYQHFVVGGSCIEGFRPVQGRIHLVI